MIFIDGVRKTKFDEEIAELSKIFTNSFDGGNAPIIVNRTKSSQATAEIFRPSQTDAPVGRRRVSSPPHWASCKGKFKGKDGLMHQWRYSTTLPSYDKSGEPIFSSEQLEIKDGMVINPNDIEKLVALYFYCPLFKNGKQSRSSAAFEFVIPSAAAKSRIERVSFEYEYTTELLREGKDRKDYNWVKAMYNALALQSTNIEADDRVQLYDMVIGDAGFRERYERAKLNISAVGKNNGARIVNDISDIITAAVKERFLVEENGFWVIKDLNGTTTKTLTQVIGTKAQDKKLNLTEFLISNPVDLDELKLVVQD